MHSCPCALSLNASYNYILLTIPLKPKKQHRLTMMLINRHRCGGTPELNHTFTHSSTFDLTYLLEAYKKKFRYFKDICRNICFSVRMIKRNFNLNRQHYSTILGTKSYIVFTDETQWFFAGFNSFQLSLLSR